MEKRTYSSDFSDLTRDYDWTWSNNTIYIYSKSDPNTRYAEIEVPQLIDGVSTNDHNYIAFDNLYVAYYKELVLEILPMEAVRLV